MKNSQLMKTEDLFSQFKLNKKITLLYREYKDKMYDDGPEQKERKKSLNQTQTISANVRKNRAGSFAQTKNRVQSFSNVLNESQTWSNSKKGERFNMQDPFINKAYMNKSKQLEKNIQNNHEQL